MKDRIGRYWRDLALLVLLGLVVWFGVTIIRLESYRYANSLGYCEELSGEMNRTRREECLRKTETRANRLWHLVHGLRLI